MELPPRVGEHPSIRTKGHSRIVSALADLGLVSAYHAFHHVDQGHETHATYHHLFKAGQSWHIDFCFVPASWVDRLAGVEVIDGDDWTIRSDHLPLMSLFAWPTAGTVRRKGRPVDRKRSQRVRHCQPVDG
jgi:exonuclease III